MVALDGGYLVDPETPYGGTLKAGAVGFEQIESIPCLALLGEPGIGKSDVLQRIESTRRATRLEGVETLYVDLRSYGAADQLYRGIFESSQFREWVNSTATLEIFLDSLDECLVHLRTVAAILLDEFKKYPVSRLRLRVACRAADWPALLDEELPRIWGGEGFAAYELAPLRRGDVSQLADLNGVVASDFLSAVEAVEVAAFAAIPLTATLLIQEFKLKRALPESRLEIYRNGCHALCSERNLSRQAAGAVGALEPRQRLAVAERIAALSLFCRRPIIGSAEGLTECGPDVATVDLIASPDARTQGGCLGITADNVRETLRTALFVTASLGRRRWMHWSYAEFLAASWIGNQRLTFEQQCDLLFQFDSHGSPRVVPQLREVAAWVAAMNVEFMDHLVVHDPAVLLSGTAGPATAAVRERAVEVLLRQIDQGLQGDFRDELIPRFATLSHPGLGAQLKPYIEDAGKDVAVRRVAVEIAESCKIASLSDDLIAVALNRDDIPHIRGRAAAAVAEIGDERHRALLEPLLRATPEEDPDDELKAAALEALSGKMSVQEILPHILPARRPNYLGSYWGFVALELPKRIQVEDLPLVLRWISTLTPNEGRDSAIERLVNDILGRSWREIEQPGVLAALAEFTSLRISRYESPYGEHHGERVAAPTLSDSARRRLLVAMAPRIAEQTTGHPVLALVQHGLLISADTPWLLEQLKSAEDRCQAVWAAGVQFVFDPQLSGHYDLVLAATHLNSALLSSVGHLFESLPLDSQRAESLRTAHYERQTWERRVFTKPVTHPPMQTIVDGWLERIEKGEIDAWWRLNRDMTLQADSDTYPPAGEFEADLTVLPGWTEVDAETHRRYLAAAERYLRLAEPDNARWLGTSTFHRPAAAGYRAMWLLYSCLPEALEKLPEQDWAKWAAIAIAFPSKHDAKGAEIAVRIVAEIYRRAPEEVRAALLSLVDHENTQHGRVFVQRRVQHCWDASLKSAVLDKVRSDEALRPLTIGALLAALITHGCPEAVAYAREMVVSASDMAMRVEAGVVLLQLVPEKVWASIKAAILDDSAFGTGLFLELASRCGYGNPPLLVTRLPEAEAGELYLWLSRHFVRSEDPQHEGAEAHFVGSRESVANLRDGILRYLIEKGTTEAVDAVRTIADVLKDEAPWLKYLTARADTARRRRVWEGVAPEVLDSLVEQSSSRLVNSEEQLMELVLQSLGRLEASLHGTPPAVGDLWDGNQPKDELDLSDYVVRHLRRDLGARHGIVANREVRIRREQSTDILVEAVAFGSGNGMASTVAVVVEVKGCWHADLETAMETQLRDRYLRDNDCRQGLYLVGWFRDASWTPTDYRLRRTPRWSLDEAREKLEAQARILSSPRVGLRSLVLDATHH